MSLLLCHHGHLLLVFLLAAASHGDGDIPADGDTYVRRKCEVEPYACGDVEVRYPFYLSGATGSALPDDAGSSYYCGYAGLEILCDGGGRAILRLDGDNYTVSRIDYAGVTVSLADAEVAGGGDGGGGGGSCPTVDHNVTIPPSVRLQYPASTVAYLFFFLGCTFGPEDDVFRPHKPPTIKPITCGGADEGLTTGLSFALPERDVPPKDWWRACKSVYRAPVLRGALPADAQDPGWRKDGYARALRGGFQLSWDRSSGRCGRCEQSHGRCGYTPAGEFLGCLCDDGRVDSNGCSRISDSAAPPSGTGKFGLIAGATAGGVGALLVAGVIVFFIRKRKQRKVTSSSKLGCREYESKRKSKQTARIESFLQKNGTIYPKRYTYAQVKRMTKSFAEKLGQGGFGAVYRGGLSDGRQIAVKTLKDYKTDGEDFINEVASISKTSHVNVVTLLGFCLEGSKRALIYDYMPNGSLEKYAFKDNSKGENTLGWEKLFDIAVGIARGLEYLHRGCNTRIVHFDIKPHNILLDQDFCPKITDFGLAKLCLNKESAISIGGARGTIGYIAPEVYSKQFGAVSSKSDVYSYGMMVLEMVGARDKNINANSESSSQYFPQWIYDHLDEYCVSASEINGEITEIARKMIVVGLWCIQLSATNRPTMTRVVEMLEGSTSGLELPPKVLLI